MLLRSLPTSSASHGPKCSSAVTCGGLAPSVASADMRNLHLGGAGIPACQAEAGRNACPTRRSVRTVPSGVLAVCLTGWWRRRLNPGEAIAQERRGPDSKSQEESPHQQNDEREDFVEDFVLAFDPVERREEPEPRHPGDERGPETRSGDEREQERAVPPAGVRNRRAGRFDGRLGHGTPSG